MAESEESKVMTKKMEEISSTAPIDIEKGREYPLVTEMEAKLKRLPPLSSECCIYKVPERLRSVNEKAYTPKVVSIGPVHHGKEKSFEVMENHKSRYLQAFLSRSNQRRTRLENCIKKIKDQEARLRSCYEVEDVGSIRSEDFVKIILVDAAFIIELFLRFSHVVPRDENDRMFNKPRMISDIMTDIVLLENQLPFFILEDLSAEDEIVSTKGLSMINLSYEFCKISNLFELTEHWDLEKLSSPPPEHFVHLLRTVHVLPLPEVQGAQLPDRDRTIPNITKLHQAGVKLEVGSDSNIFDIQFNSGTLKIPKIRIHDHTELIIRNLLAFEQCHFLSEHRFCDYALILDNFMDTEQDVELLVKKGIVENQLGDNKAVCSLINNVCNGVVWDPGNFYYALLYENLNKYCEKPLHKSMAILRQKYFNTPWAIISFIAAVFILVLTAIQAVCSVISVN